MYDMIRPNHISRVTKDRRAHGKETYMQIVPYVHEWFDEYERDEDRLPWPSQSSDPNRTAAPHFGGGR